MNTDNTCFILDMNLRSMEEAVKDIKNYKISQILRLLSLLLPNANIVMKKIFHQIQNQSFFTLLAYIRQYDSLAASLVQGTCLYMTT